MIVHPLLFPQILSLFCILSVIYMSILMYGPWRAAPDYAVADPNYSQVEPYVSSSTIQQMGAVSHVWIGYDGVPCCFSRAPYMRCYMFMICHTNYVRYSRGCHLPKGAATLCHCAYDSLRNNSYHMLKLGISTHRYTRVRGTSLRSWPRYRYRAYKYFANSFGGSVLRPRRVHLVSILRVHYVFGSFLSSHVYVDICYRVDLLYLSENWGSFVTGDGWLMHIRLYLFMLVNVLCTRPKHEPCCPGGLGVPCSRRVISNSNTHLNLLCVTHTGKTFTIYIYISICTFRCGDRSTSTGSTATMQVSEVCRVGSLTAAYPVH